MKGVHMQPIQLTIKSKHEPTEGQCRTHQESS